MILKDQQHTKSAFCLILLAIFLVQSCTHSEDLGSMETYKRTSVSIKQTETFLKEQMAELNIPALSIAIINNGKIVYNKTTGVAHNEKEIPVTENSIFEAASLSKPIFAYFVMKLSEKGIIDIDRPLHYYLPDEAIAIDERYENVSARMVLNHSTGFPNWRWFEPLPENSDLNRGDFFILKDPGTAFTYSGEAYQYLARVIAHLNFVNMNELNELFQKEVAEPLGIEHGYFVWDDYLYKNKVYGHKEGKPRRRDWGSGLPHQNSKILNAAGGLQTEAKSYATFLTAIINGEGLFPETFKEMLEPHTEVPGHNSNYLEDGITSWGLSFGIKPM